MASENVVWHPSNLPRDDRWAALEVQGATVWLTGLSGSGKSTVAAVVERRLLERRQPAYLLDGDNLRHGLNGDLGFSAEDRSENVRRVGEVARLFADAGVVSLVPLISPYRADRDRARAAHVAAEVPFFEVFVNTPIEVCEARDPKGLYAKARAGEIKGFTGIDDPYEAPLHPDLVLTPDDGDAEAHAHAVLHLLAGGGPSGSRDQHAVSTTVPVRKVGALVLVVALALAGCGGDGGGDDGNDDSAASSTTSTTERVFTEEELAAVDLIPGLLKLDDFPRPDEVEPILLGGDLGAVGAGQRIKMCGEDLRADLGAASGRFSQFRVDQYAVTHSVTALPALEASALGQRFAALAGDCTTPWTQEDPNGGLITRHVVGGFPIPDLGTDAAAFLVRAENDLGRDDAVVLLAIDGPYVSSLTVTGPVGDRFQIVRPLELALAQRLERLPQPGEG